MFIRGQFSHTRRVPTQEYILFSILFFSWFRHAGVVTRARNEPNNRVRSLDRGRSCGRDSVHVRKTPREIETFRAHETFIIRRVPYSR